MCLSSGTEKWRKKQVLVSDDDADGDVDDDEDVFLDVRYQEAALPNGGQDVWSVPTHAGGTDLWLLLALATDGGPLKEAPHKQT